jgi:hypothetical protein
VKAISDTGLGFDIGRTSRLAILIQLVAECGDGGSQHMEIIVRTYCSPDLMSQSILCQEFPGVQNEHFE